MNTIRSVGYGWGVLVVAGGGAYYFAKRSIASDREARAQLELERRQRQERMRQQDRLLQVQSRTTSAPPITGHNGEHSGNPSHEASQDPAPISHAPSTEGERLKEKSKYEASEPWRSRKGDRLG